MRRTIFFVGPLLFSLAAPVAAQAPAAPQPITVGDVTVSGSLRTRLEMWDWFDQTPAGGYAFSGNLFRIGVSQSKPRFDWQIELAVPFLLGLPDDAIASGAQGQLGLGATYYAANGNDRNAASAFIKQAAIRFKNLAGVSGQSLKVGRMEFIDGTEVAPKNATLAALKRDRIAHRLIGNFAFSHVGRSVDGAQYVFNTPTINVTALAARPTQGVYQVDGWDELAINVFYGALTGQLGGSSSAAGEWRAFGLGYQDYRDTAVKTDNRPLAVRSADKEHINLATFGGHYVGAIATSAGTFDALIWGAAQTGSWGTLDHRAGALALEGGWQPAGAMALAPWIRGGYDASTGDDNPADSRHGTFFQLLPTPRVYARFPFFNLMNSHDAFGELVLRPKRTTLRADVHALRLASATDLWYLGGGAFQPATFGYTGRPSNGHTDLATLYDVSADVTVTPHVLVTGYYAYAAGGDVVTAIYPSGGNAQFGYLELTLRF